MSIGSSLERRGLNEEKARSAPMAERAYDDLKWLILSGELTAGSLMTETVACEQTGFGKAPIRAALSQLKHDRLIDIVPRKGFFIRPWNLKEAKKIVQVRINIESQTTELAAIHASDEAISDLKEIVAKAAIAVEETDRRSLMWLDQQFHVLIAEATGNEVLVEIVSFLKQRSYSLWHMSISGTEMFQRVQIQHEAILEAIVNKDPVAAVSAMNAHLDSLS